MNKFKKKMHSELIKRRMEEKWKKEKEDGKQPTFVEKPYEEKFERILPPFLSKYVDMMWDTNAGRFLNQIYEKILPSIFSLLF